MDGRGIGATTRRALTLVERGKEPFEAGRLVYQENPRSSAGNGSVMRCVPVALRYHDDFDRLIRVSTQQAAITHPDERCMWGAAAVNLAVRELLHGNIYFIDEVLHRLRDRAPRALVEAIHRVPREAQADLPITVAGETGYVVHCVEIAFWFVMHDRSLEDALVYLAQAGRATGSRRCRRDGWTSSWGHRGSGSSPNNCWPTGAAEVLRLAPGRGRGGPWAVAGDPIHHVAVVERDRDDPPIAAPPPVEPDEPPAALGPPLPHAALPALPRPQLALEVALGPSHQGDAPRVHEGHYGYLPFDHVGAQVEDGAVGGIARAHPAVHHLRGAAHRLAAQRVAVGEGLRPSGESAVRHPRREPSIRKRPPRLGGGDDRQDEGGQP